jgi:NADPH-dependent 2,4-dienoyl-CoA reductase/sulfur reductase-like enzyme
VERIAGDASGAAVAVHLASGARLPARAVVVGVGARPRVHPFEKALSQAPVPPGGIAVDASLRAAGPGVPHGSVYAIGDVACFPIQLYGCACAYLRLRFLT